MCLFVENIPLNVIPNYPKRFYRYKIILVRSPRLCPLPRHHCYEWIYWFLSTIGLLRGIEGAQFFANSSHSILYCRWYIWRIIVQKLSQDIPSIIRSLDIISFKHKIYLLLVKCEVPFFYILKKLQMSKFHTYIYNHIYTYLYIYIYIYINM